MHVTFFSFFVGGYVTTYQPARISRVSPVLNGATWLVKSLLPPALLA